MPLGTILGREVRRLGMHPREGCPKLMLHPEFKRVAISAAIYRGAKCPTLKTAEKQPERVPSGSWQNSRRNSRKKQSKHPKHSCFELFVSCFGCSSGCFSAVLP